MQRFIKKVKRKINGVIINLIVAGATLVILAVLIVWTDFVLRLVIGLLVIITAYAFFYLALKLNWLKKEMEKFIKF